MLRSRVFFSRHGGVPLKVFSLVALSLMVFVRTSASADTSGGPDPERGRELFTQQCASCHGDQGQGVEGAYPEPLQGDYSAVHLREIIELTMPEGEPDACVGQDARDVAAFVFERFYSDQAKQRREVARIELSRLTVPQYRNAVTDLIQSFRPPADPETDGGGLRGRYFATRKFKKKVIDRTDPAVDFGFGEGVPDTGDEATDESGEDDSDKDDGDKDDSDKDDGDKEDSGDREGDFGDAEEFSIRWQGGLFVEQTGTYELRVYAENGVRLWLNDPEQPLIDGWVRSGEKTEHVESLFLLGGRTYPIRLDFHKRSDPSAAVRLLWQPPDGVTEPIPSYHLRRGEFPKQFVVTTHFPPDDRSVGYERGTRVSKEWDEATTLGAIETANAVVRDLDSLADLERDDSEEQRVEKARAFCRQLVQRAFRRPLDDTLKQRYIDRHFAAEDAIERAVKRVVILALKSPQFLYPHLGLEDDLLVASRLSYALCDSLPDDELLAAARGGQLQTAEQVTAEAERLLEDPRARAKLRDFFQYWLRIDSSYDLTKDEALYPEFTPELVVDLRRSLERFIDATVWSDESDFRELLRAEEIWVNERLARFLDVPAPDPGRFAPAEFDAEPRSGVLTHPYLMATHAHSSTTSPIHRGVFLVRGILGRTLRSPPDAIELVDASLMPEMTTRERVEMQTEPASCQKCHALINPMGFALEHYDAVGRYRASEQDRPINASGSYPSSGGEVLEFSGARQLGDALAEHEQTARNFVERLFEFMTKQPIGAYRPGLADELVQGFVRSDYHIRELVARIATLAALEENLRASDG